MRGLLAYTLAALVLAPQQPPVKTGAPAPAAPQTVPQTPRVRSATGDALDRYLRGEYSEAVAMLSVLGGFNVEQADNWIRAAGPEAAPRRRLAAATLILEVTVAKEAWPSGLIEWACDGFRLAGPPTAAEAVWLRASIALAQQDGLWVFLMPAVFDRPPATPTIKRPPVRPAAPPGHLSHARARFPDDPHFALAEAVGLEVASTGTFDPRAPRTDQTPVAFDRLSASLAPVGGISDDRRALLEQARVAFDGLRAQKAVQAEASLRLGYTLLRQGRTTEARDRLREIETATGDAWVSYLAWMLRGWIHASEGRLDEAATSYEAAMTAAPDARSAAALLVATLLRSDRLADAEALSEKVLAAQPGADPWHEYLQGDARNFGSLLAQLRKDVR